MSNSSTTSLPPGFRFHPTDEELILHYLRNRAATPPCPVSIIAEVDIYKFDPWELPAKATFGDREWYFFSPRDRKYPNGVRPNRAAGSGYWKATGTDKPIHGAGGAEESSSIGVKKALVFYTGKPPKGQKTDWIMHEYRLAEAGNTNTYKPLKLRDRSMRLDDWVLCRIYKKSSNLPPVPPLTDDDYVSGAEDVNVMQTLQAATTGGCGIAQGAAPTKLATKSFSISELFDDYSAVGDDLQFDAAQHPDLPGGFDYASLVAHAHVPPFGGGGGGLGCENTSGYQIPKRQRTTSTGDGYGEPCFAAPANLSNSNPFDSSQYGLLINQQLLLNSHLGLHCTEHAAQELIHHISHK